MAKWGTNVETFRFSRRAGNMRAANVCGGPVAQNEQPVVRAHDISYSKRSYRSFEFASFSVGAGEVLAVLSSSHAPARDLLLAIAGLVRPTSGTLVVAGTDLTAARTLPFGLGTRLSRTTAGLGVFEHVAPVQSVCTVEEAVAREMRLRSPRGGTSDALPLLAAMGVATRAGEQVSRLDPASRARLSAALALAGEPRVALIDLTDPFVSGLSANDACELMACLRAYASEYALAVVVATGEERVTHAASSALLLDEPAPLEMDSSADEVMA